MARVAFAGATSFAAMNFAFSEEQEELRKSVRRFLESKSPETAVRRLMETTEGYDPDVWQQMGQELGLQGLAIPEEYGGSGYTYVELIIVLEEMGRALLAAPYFSTVALAANALLTSGDDAAKKELLPGIAAGDTIATVAFTEDNGRWDVDGVGLTAKKSGDGYTLDGHKMFVIDGHTANLIIAVAKTDAGLSLFAVDGRCQRPHPHAAVDDGPDPQAGPPRVQRHARPTHRHRRWRRRRPPADARPRRRGPRRRAGRWRPEGASTCRSSTPRCACSSAGPSVRSRPSSTSAPTCCSRSSRPSRPPTTRAGPPPTNDELPVVASLAKAYCSDAYFHAAAENIQIHGGIGFTWEHPAHLYFKRAKSSELLFGDPTYHRELLAQRIGL